MQASFDSTTGRITKQALHLPSNRSWQCGKTAAFALRGNFQRKIPTQKAGPASAGTRPPVLLVKGAPIPPSVFKSHSVSVVKACAVSLAPLPAHGSHTGHQLLSQSFWLEPQHLQHLQHRQHLQLPPQPLPQLLPQLPQLPPQLQHLQHLQQHLLQHISKPPLINMIMVYCMGQVDNVLLFSGAFPFCVLAM